MCRRCATCRNCVDPDSLPAGIEELPLTTRRGTPVAHTALVRGGLQLAVLWRGPYGIHIQVSGLPHWGYVATLAEAAFHAVEAADVGWPPIPAERHEPEVPGMDRSLRPLRRRYTGKTR